MFALASSSLRQNAVHHDYPEGELIAVKKWSVERRTLLALNGRHLGYVAEGEAPSTFVKMADEEADEEATAVATVNGVL